MMARRGKDCRAERMPTVRKILSILSLAVLLASPAWAMRTPVFGGSSSNLSASATRYVGFIATPVATNDTQIRSVVSLTGAMEGLYVYLAAAPDNGGGTQSYTFTLQKNGADTAITCSISETSTTCLDIINSVSMVAGDTFSVKVVPSGTPTATFTRFSSVFNSGSGGGSLLYTSANASSPSTSAASAVNVNGNLGWSQANNSTVAPTSGTISSLYVLNSSAPGAAASGKQYVYTVQKNSVDTAVTCTMFETATTCNDTTHSFTFVAGDFIKVVATPTGTPTAGFPAIGLVMTPTIDGESMFGGTYGGGAFSASVNNYQGIIGFWGGFGTTDAITSAYIPSSSIVAKKLRVYSSNSPGTSKSVLTDVRLNTAVDTTITCTRTGTSSTTCSDTTHEVSLAAGDFIYFRWVPTGTPTTSTTNYVSIVLYIDPADTIYDSTLY